MKKNDKVEDKGISESKLDTSSETETNGGQTEQKELLKKISDKVEDKVLDKESKITTQTKKAITI